jgi:hypothetical protein
VEQLASRVLRESGEQFARELRSGSNEQAIGRLARQLSETSLFGVVRVLVPHAVKSVERLVRSLLENCAQLRLRNGGAARARTLIWEAILTELIRASSATLDPGRLAQAAVRVIAQELDDAQAQTLLHSGDGASEVAPAAKALELPEQTKPTPAAEADSALESGQSAARLLRRKQFAGALESGTAVNVSEDWAQLLAQDAQWVEDLLRREGQRAVVRRRIAENFPEPLRVGIVELLVPTEREFIETVVARPEVFSREVNPSVQQADALKSQLWEFTLTYLLVERGSTFNRRSYMGSVLRQMASRDGIDYEELLDGITSALRAIRPISGAHKQILDLLVELGEARPSRSSAEPDPVASDVKRFGSEHPDELLRRRLRGEPGDGTELVSVIERLAREYPERLSQLKRELQAGVLSWQAACAHFSAAELEAVVKALVGLGGAGSAAFLASIEEHAGQSSDRKRYYAAILSCLIEDRPVDLEAIVGASRSEEIEPLSESEQQERITGAKSVSETFRTALKSGNQNGLEGIFRQLSGHDRQLVAHALRQIVLRDGLERKESPNEVAPAPPSNIGFDELHNQMTDLPSGLDEDRTALSATRHVDAHLTPAQGDAGHDAGEAELLAYLRGTYSLTAADAAALRQRIVSGIEQRSDALRRHIEFALDNPQAAARIIDLSPVHILARLVRLLRPADYDRIQRSADLLGDACESIVIPAQRVHIERLKWQCILFYLFELGRSFSVTDFAREFARYVAARLRLADPQRWCQDLAQEVAGRDRSADRAIVRDIELGLSQALDAPATETVREPPATSPWEELAPGETIYVENAGLVLAAAYVPRLFAMLNLTDNEQFKDTVSAERGVHLLQYLATGVSASPEYQLALNKLLCGVALDIPVADAIEITSEERSAIDGLLEAMIQHWKILGKTSVAGLRASFLQREGKLTRKDQSWHLLVVPKAFDMLLDQLPWGYSTIKSPWMSEVLNVQWR